MASTLLFGDIVEREVAFIDEQLPCLLGVLSKRNSTEIIFFCGNVQLSDKIKCSESACFSVYKASPDHISLIIDVTYKRGNSQYNTMQMQPLYTALSCAKSV